MRNLTEANLTEAVIASISGAEDLRFQEIMSTLYRPVVILGGPGRGDVRAVLEDIRHAMDAGAIGTTIGRNIWEHESPARVVADLAAIVHEDASVDVAMRQLEPSFAVA